MQQYTKSNQYYEDEYDRITIKRMKEFENQIRELGENHLSAVMLKFQYKTYGAERASKRDEFIRNRREADEYKDRLVAKTPIPKNISCKTCQGQMLFELHSFTSDERLIFYFKCSQGHLPKMAVYADGTVHYIEIMGCSYCGGPLETKKKQTKVKLTFTDTCKHCGKVEVQDFEFPKKRTGIKEDDRIKYCIKFIGKRTLEEDLQAIIDCVDYFKEKEQRYDYNHIEQLNIAQLETKLTEELEKVGFIKVSFEKPKSGRHLTVEFSAQDSLSRDEVSSVKAMKKTINKSLFPTNWRLMTTGISYKLGFLTGELKGYSVEEDLIKIGKEIDAKQKDQK